jgi:hypothetical protein
MEKLFVRFSTLIAAAATPVGVRLPLPGSRGRGAK